MEYESGRVDDDAGAVGGQMRIQKYLVLMQSKT
jgi:hypothetical protein